MCTQPPGRSIDRAQGAQRGQAAQAVQQKTVHLTQLHHLLLAGRLGTPAHDGHEQGNQGRRHHQDQRRHPGLPGHHGGNHQRQHPGAPHCGLVARQPGHNRLRLFSHRAGGLARRHAPCVQGRTAGQRLDHLGPQGVQLGPGGLKAQAHAMALAPGLGRTQHQQPQRQPTHLGGTTCGHPLHGGGQQCRLRQPQQRGHDRPRGTAVGTATLGAGLACRLIEVSGFHLILNFQYLLKFMQMLGFLQNNFHTGSGSRVKHCDVDFHQFTPIGRWVMAVS